MTYAYKSTTRILSLILVVVLMLTAFPTTVFASIDEPLNGVTGNGWDDFIGLPETEPDLPPVTTEPPSGDAPNVSYTLLRWTTSGSYQPFFTLEKETIDGLRLKIIKKSTSGKLLSGAEFSVTGPGVSQTGLLTNNKGEILVDIPSPGGTYTVTETTPPSGYLPADPNSQTVTINTTNPTDTVIFENEPEGEEEEESSSFRIEVETEVSTDVQVRNGKEFEYSRAYGQFTIRKHDQDGKSLDGALFDIEVRFTDGTVLRENGWEVDNGARLFAYTHPENNHDAATITVTEVQPPRYYTGDPTPKTVTVQPSYTRTIITTTWTETIWTYFYRYTVIEISPNGEETDVEAWTESRDEFEVTPSNVENFPEYVDGDREITVTFVNQRITGDIIVTKRDANTGQALAGATVHLWGTDLGEPANIDRTIVTGADGTAIFDNLPPGTYAFKETQPPYGYNINNDLQTAVVQSGQVLQKEIRNYRKDGLIIKKVDQDGKPLGGAVFELRRGSGEVLLRETTNENGIIFRDYLVDDTYVIEEISAPEGYLLDENPIQSIRIYDTDDNKSYTVTFVNKKKPSIEITKVDGDTPTVKLTGAVFRITDTRTNQYWDIQTGADGTALLENLNLNTTYIVEETESPQGYVNSGYRQEIVLKECRKHTITVSNFHMPKLTIIKKDVSSGALLSGATFRISWNSGADYRDVTTDAKGEAVMPNLTPGWYTVTETKAPAGYLLNSTPQQVLIVDGQGIGYEFDGNGVYGVDLDHVIDKAGTLTPQAREVVDKLASYTEISPSGTGIHAFVFAPDANITRHRKKDYFLEIYSEGRYFTVTGNAIGGTKAIETRTEELQKIHDKFLLPDAAQRAVNRPPPMTVQSSAEQEEFLQTGLKRDKVFADMWAGHRRHGNESGDDLALMNRLAYWCNADPEAMIQAFLRSPYYAQKDEIHKKKCQRADYLPNTAKNSCATTYSTAKVDRERWLASRKRERSYAR